MTYSKLHISQNIPAATSKAPIIERRSSQSRDERRRFGALDGIGTGLDVEVF